MLKPILFNTEMVKAIQDGRKTQTRRVCKGQGECNPVQCGYHPPYKPGDILWVREKWKHVYNFDDGDQIIEGTGRYVYYADNPMPFDYWVDPDTGEHKEQMPWKPSIHMPKDAARIFLRVKDVRAERLWDISEADCLAEGIMGFTKDGKITKFSTQSGDMPSVPWQDMPENPVHAFWDLWNSTIKSADRNRYGWLENPWVWVIEFERIEKPEDWV